VSAALAFCSCLGLLTVSCLKPRCEPRSAAKASTTRKRQKPRVLVPRPSLEGWEGLDLHQATPGALTKAFPYWAVATKAEVYIHGSHGKSAWVWGRIRHGQRVPVKFKVRRDGCSRGNWYETPSGGFICNTHGFAITKSSEPAPGVRPPRLDRPLPYTYLKLTLKPALQFERVPSADELKAAEKGLKEGTELPGVVASTKKGAYYVAVDREETSRKGGKFFRTTLGYYVSAAGTEVVEGSTMHGELLSPDKDTPLARRSVAGEHGLPLAFVYREQTPVHCLQKDKNKKDKKSKEKSLRRCGVADKHGRFRVAGETTVEGKTYVLSPGGHAVERSLVRVADRLERPKAVPKGEKWVHFDLPEQTVVAYEGDRPVFASLISSGKEGHETPAGTYRIYLKYISDRMSGDDPVDGPYDIGEVPWVMYYKDSFAVHGAYWHDVFGVTRSHGCTNLAPADARWLLLWTEPEVPPGWHGRYVREGTVFHFTRGS
jgi:hypothetical protein